MIQNQISNKIWMNKCKLLFRLLLWFHDVHMIGSSMVLICPSIDGMLATHISIIINRVLLLGLPWLNMICIYSLFSILNDFNTRHLLAHKFLQNHSFIVIPLEKPRWKYFASLCLYLVSYYLKRRIRQAFWLIWFETFFYRFW